MHRTNSWLTAILFLGCLVLGYLAIHQKSELRRGTLDRNAVEKAATEQIDYLQRQITALRAEQRIADGKIAQLSRGASAARSESDGGGGKVQTIHINSIIKEHPEYAALYAKQIRRDVLGRYGDSLSSLNLASEQLAKLKDLLVERQMSTLDAQSEATAAGFVFGSPGWLKAFNQASSEMQQDMEQKLTAILGNNPDGMLQQLEFRANFQDLIKQRYAVDFEDAGAALSADQSRGLAQALNDANYTGKDPSTIPPGYEEPDPATGLTPKDRKILDEAAAVLTPAQLQVLKSDRINDAKQQSILAQYVNGQQAYSIGP